MRLPKFWRDKGGWNDNVTTASMAVCIFGTCGIGFWVDWPWLCLAGLILGPVVGWFLGFFVVSFLCKFFLETKEK